MDKYIKCPRCEINYILEKQKLCDVCKAELKLAPDIYSEDDEEMILCPICKTNYIFPDEDMCSTCRENAENNVVEKDPDIESDEEWRSFLDDDKETIIADDEGNDEISLSQLHEEEEEGADDEEDLEFGEKLDYDDNFDDLDDDDLDDDEEDDEDEDEDK